VSHSAARSRQVTNRAIRIADGAFSALRVEAPPDSSRHL